MANIRKDKQMNKLTPLLSTARKSYVDKLKLAWYFETTFEKSILVILCLLGTLRIFQWII